MYHAARQYLRIGISIFHFPFLSHPAFLSLTFFGYIYPPSFSLRVATI